MRTFLLMFYINLMIGCYQKNLGPKGSVVLNDEEGYWHLTGSKTIGKSRGAADARNKVLLKTIKKVMQRDSLEVPIYSNGMHYIVFNFFNKAVTKTSSVQAVEYGNTYNSKSEQSRFWYRINQDIGFLAILNVKPDNRQTTRIELSNVMKSATYKPELDSLRYIYEPTVKF